MSFKDKEKQKEFQRNWVKNRRLSILKDKLCSCGKRATEAYNIKSNKKKFSWSCSLKKIEEKLKEATFYCENCFNNKSNIDRHYKNVRHNHAKSIIEERKTTPTYNSWRSMKERCYNENRENYQYYGAIGVTVCERWHTFENFLKDMGERPLGTTIDRIDPNGNYEPSNCRWATSLEQGRNKRR